MYTRVIISRTFGTPGGRDKQMFDGAVAPGGEESVVFGAEFARRFRDIM